MSRTIKVATTQMDAMPAPRATRLERAEKLVSQAARAGAQLVILPELFNIGYAYSDDNFERAETIDGQTRLWMEINAARFGIHLAGTFLLLENGEIYNTMLLFSPRGEMWRYDKSYPWAWERGYFRERRGMSIAKTELGDLGMMICWDLGHLNMWKQYAGKADMIVIASCPPDGPSASYDLPNDEKFTFNEMGRFMGSLKSAGIQFFGEMVDQQAKWLGVPVVNSGASGRVNTYVPKAAALLRMFILFAPRFLKLLPRADQLQMSCEMIPSCKVVGANGQVLCERNPSEGEGFIVTEVTLNDSKFIPKERQPSPPLGFITAQLSFLNADVVVPAMMRSVYKNGLKKIRK